MDGFGQPDALRSTHFLNDAISQLVGLGAAALAFVVIPPVIDAGGCRAEKIAGNGDALAAYVAKARLR